MSRGIENSSAASQKRLSHLASKRKSQIKWLFGTDYFVLRSGSPGCSCERSTTRSEYLPQCDGINLFGKRRALAGLGRVGEKCGLNLITLRLSKF